MIEIDGSSLSIKEVVAVARNKENIKLSKEATERVSQSHKWIEEIISANKPSYGVNTGFGIFADQRIKPDDSITLNRNLILSHAVCTGPILPEEIVRAAMLIRANTLCIGFSGVRLNVIKTLIDMLNRGVTPLIPSQGSLGSSGDLAPLAHMCLVLTSDEQDHEKDSGIALYDGHQMSGKAAMKAAGIPRIILGPKEGLALINGATFSAAIGAIACHDAEKLLNNAELALAMSMEALLGRSDAFDPRLHRVRPHPGQSYVAEKIRRMTKGSTLIDAGNQVQDAYSLRCAPQVQGAAYDALNYVRQVIEREINSVTDNPLIFDAQEVISGGNFHGEPVGMVMDFLSIAMAEVGAISERRIFRLIDGRLNLNLPPMLVDHPQLAGINSGMMMPHYSAASLVLENQTLATPDSVHSLPTSAEQEDHNANSMTAARHARQIIENSTHIIAIELYCACRAIDLRLRQMPNAIVGNVVKKAYNTIRVQIPYHASDKLWGKEIDLLHSMIDDDLFSEL